MRTKRSVFICWLAAVTVATASAQRTTANDNDFANKVAAHMNAMAEVEGFNGSVCVTTGDRTLLSEGYGFANLEHDIANTSSTKFRIGSVTKQFTAMAVMILHEQGKLDVDGPISKYLPDTPEAWSEVTIHHLLTHTSGIPSYTSMFDYGFKMMMPQSTSQMIDRFSDKPLEFEPGEEFAYSNSGYFLLGVIIKAASDTSYERFLQEAIFDPLELSATGYDRYAKVIPNRATGYEQRGEVLVHAAYLDMSQPYAAGSLYSTVEDLQKWDRALRQRKLLSEAGYTKMWTPEQERYAYGWHIGKHDDADSLSHGGGINGFRSYFLRIPEARLSVSVLCNVQPSNPAKVANELASIALGKEVPLPRIRTFVKVDEQVLATYVGKYRVNDKFVLVVKLNGGKLVAGPEGRPSSTLQAESDTTFFAADVDGELSFVKDGDGRVVAAVLNQGGTETRAMRID